MDGPNRLGTIRDRDIAALAMLSSAPAACSGERPPAAAGMSGRAPSDDEPSRHRRSEFATA
jgi:hypothetical protein